MNAALLTSVAGIGYWLVQTEGQVGLGALAMALPLALQLTFQSHWIMFELTAIFEGLGIVEEGIAVLTNPHGITDKPNAEPLSVTSQTASISYSNVWFSYEKEGQPVLENYSLDIPAGQKIGFVGCSGAGKSTITNLIVRAFDVQGGSISINGQNIADVTRKSLREAITVVTQDSYLFHRSIVENIRYGHQSADMDTVIVAAKKAYAHEFIEGLEDGEGRKGYDALVGERGVKLSGRQRQRIAIARASLKDAPVLILDEATSALDSESEHLIQESLKDLMQGKTVIAIAHRLSTIAHMDRLIIMQDGQIIEDGSHKDLLASNGLSAKLWAMQSGGFLNV
jgi:ATP-binding cassette subfamily B multidrug efflux pump